MITMNVSECNAEMCSNCFDHDHNPCPVTGVYRAEGNLVKEDKYGLGPDTWYNDGRKLQYMARAAQKAYPNIPEKIIHDYCEGDWPNDWDDAAAELIEELGTTEHGMAEYTIDMSGPYGGRYIGTITEKEEKDAEYNADTYWNPESDYDGETAGMVGIVGIAALTLFSLAIAKGFASGNNRK